MVRINRHQKLFGIAKSTLSKIQREVVLAIIDILGPKYIKFPS